MIPLSLSLHNFLSYGPRAPALDFTQFKVACLTGSNGHGKSALLDAITYALWDEARKSQHERRPDEGLLRLVAAEMRVEFCFALDDEGRIDEGVVIHAQELVDALLGADQRGVLRQGLVGSAGGVEDLEFELGHTLAAALAEAADDAELPLVQGKAELDPHLGCPQTQQALVRPALVLPFSRFPPKCIGDGV